jgi:hypothetical protein
MKEDGMLTRRGLMLGMLGVGAAGAATGAATEPEPDTSGLELAVIYLSQVVPCPVPPTGARRLAREDWMEVLTAEPDRVYLSAWVKNDTRVFAKVPLYDRPIVNPGGFLTPKALERYVRQNPSMFRMALGL